MSALRLGILPDGTRHVIVLEPAVGRIHTTRYGVRGATFDNPVIGSHASGESRYSGKVERRTGAHSPKVRP